MVSMFSCSRWNLLRTQDEVIAFSVATMGNNLAAGRPGSFFGRNVNIKPFRNTDKPIGLFAPHNIVARVRHYGFRSSLLLDVISAHIEQKTQTQV